MKYLNKNKLLFFLPYLLNIKICFAQTTSTTDQDFVENLNILIMNLVTIFIKINLGLTLLTGVIAFVVQIIRINAYHDMPTRRQMAMKNLLGVVVSTGLVSVIGLVFSLIFYFVIS